MVPFNPPKTIKTDVQLNMLVEHEKNKVFIFIIDDE